MYGGDAHEMRNRVGEKDPPICTGKMRHMNFVILNIRGIFPASQCTGKIDHAVQAVGLNLEAEEPYWLVRNSWNTDWGLDGYIKLPYGVGACSLTEMPSYADVKAPVAGVVLKSVRVEDEVVL